MWQIRTLGDPVLRKICDPVTEETFFMSSVWSLFDEMALLMTQCHGVGLAANQIGVSRRFFIYDYKDKINLIINPEIVAHSSKLVYMKEGCLSVVDQAVEVPRWEWVVIGGQDYYGEDIECRATGFMARIFQHEIDHLDGKLIIDYKES